MANDTGVTTGAADQGDEEIVDPDLQGETGDEVEGVAERGPIPYEKFKKTNEDLKLTKAQYEKLTADFDSIKEFRDFIDELRAEGLNNSDDVRAFIARQNVGNFAQQRKAAENKAAADYHKAIAAGDTEEEALKAYQLDMKSAKLAHDEAVLAQREAEVKRGSSGTMEAKIKAALVEFPEADPDLLRKLAKVPGANIRAEAKDLHDRQTKLLVDYAKNKGKQSGTKGPETKQGSGAAAATTAAPPNALKDPKGAAAYLEQMKKKFAAT
jgi:hypothetical protein